MVVKWMAGDHTFRQPPGLSLGLERRPRRPRPLELSAGRPARSACPGVHGPGEVDL